MAIEMTISQTKINERCGEFVGAQIWKRLYRRIAFCSGWFFQWSLSILARRQLQIGDTAECNSALRGALRRQPASDGLPIPPDRLVPKLSAKSISVLCLLL